MNKEKFMEHQFAVHTNRLCKEFYGKSVLNRLEMKVKKGEIYGILGVNGAGKTTLLKLMAGLLEPTEGGAYVLAENAWTQRHQVLRNIGSLIEVPYFYEHLNAAKNLSIHLRYMGIDADIYKSLERVGLGDVGDKPVSKFSLGMRQRLGIARSMIHNPKVLLLDEPINGLDPVAIKEMRDLFVSLKNQGVTILLSSHILSEVIQTVERVAVIANGTLTLEANVKDLIAEHENNLEDFFIEKMRGEKL